jgi:membrane protease YdiL (CAAX protease family)
MHPERNHHDVGSPSAEVTADSALDRDRPFGAHLRMAWWKPLVLVIVLPLVLVVLQVLATALVGLVEGSTDPFSTEFTPLKLLAVNLSIGATGVVALLLLKWMTKAPWSAFLTGRRAVDKGRIATYVVGAAVLVSVGVGAVALVSPESTGWTDFAVSGTTVAFLFVTMLTTPVQSAGEELMYRSVLLPAAASWVRAVRPALAVGVVVSALGFAVVHGSTDPWLFGYFCVFGVSTGLMMIMSSGTEAPIAFHVVNNVIAGVVGSLLSGGENQTIDRRTATGDASVLILVAVNVAMVLLVWFTERRRESRGAR